MGRITEQCRAIPPVRFGRDNQRGKPGLLIVAEQLGGPSPLPDVSREAARSRREAAQAKEHSKRSATRVIEVEQILAELQAQTFVLKESLAEQGSQLENLRRRLDRADRVMAAMQASLSWRVTAPLRALKRRR